MIIRTAPPKSRQIADFLRKQIVSGKLPSGSRLDTVRNLASRFEVSRQAVESAYDLLEHEKLICRKGRQGIYVSGSHCASGATTIYFLAYDVSPSNSYLQNLIRISCPPFLKDNYSFIIRIIPNGIASEKVFREELDRISDTPGLTAVLAVIMAEDRKKIERIMRIGRPVLFLGHFKPMEFGDIPCNMVAYDNYALGRDCVRHLVSKGYTNPLVFIGSLKHRFNCEFMCGAKKEAKVRGISLDIGEIPSGLDVHGHDEYYRKKLVRNVSRKVGIDSILLAGKPQASLIETMAGLGMGVPDSVGVFSTSALPGENIDSLSPEMSVLFETIYDRIEELNDKSAEPRKIIVPMPFKALEKGTLSNRLFKTA